MIPQELIVSTHQTQYITSLSSSAKPQEDSACLLASFHWYYIFFIIYLHPELSSHMYLTSWSTPKSFPMVRKGIIRLLGGRAESFDASRGWGSWLSSVLTTCLHPWPPECPVLRGGREGECRSAGRVFQVWAEHRPWFQVYWWLQRWRCSSWHHVF